MMDTYHVEFFTKDGQRVGVQVAAYSSYDALNYDHLASFFEKIKSGYDG